MYSDSKSCITSSCPCMQLYLPVSARHCFAAGALRIQPHALVAGWQRSVRLVLLYTLYCCCSAAVLPHIRQKTQVSQRLVRAKKIKTQREWTLMCCGRAWCIYPPARIALRSPRSFPQTIRHTVQYGTRSLHFQSTYAHAQPRPTCRHGCIRHATPRVCALTIIRHQQAVR